MVQQMIQHTFNAAPIPQFPAKDLAATKTFYQKLGFSIAAEYPDPDFFLILTCGEIELHFWQYKEVVAESSIMSCYIRFGDEKGFNALYDLWRGSDPELPLQGIPRLTAPEDRPWGMREFYLVDPDGNLIKCGINI